MIKIVIIMLLIVFQEKKKVAYFTMLTRILRLKWPHIKEFATIVKTKVIAIFVQITCVVTRVESVADNQLAENLPPNISLESKSFR